jgi:hypothetical protein
MKKKTQNNESKGLVILMLCGGIAVALIVACAFFPDTIFGLFIK